MWSLYGYDHLLFGDYSLIECQFRAFFFASDDMIDASITRRAGKIAFNDSIWLGAAIYRLLKVYFKGQPYYADIIDLVQEAKYQTRMGQLIDLITAPEGRVDLSKFSLEKYVSIPPFFSRCTPCAGLIASARYRLIVVFKTAYYSFYLPVALALYMCNVPESYTAAAADGTAMVVRPYDVAREILIAIGEYSQVQDDFLDYSSTPGQIGKIGSDIVDNKYSWCINKALSLANAEQRAVLEENYGRQGPEKEARVKEVYEQVGLRRIYVEYEENAYRTLSAKIAEIPETAAPETLKREVFSSLLGEISKRTK